MSRCQGGANAGNGAGSDPPENEGCSPAIPDFDGTLEPFDRIGEATMAGVSTIWTCVVAYQVGPGRRGFHQWFGIDTDNLTDLQDVRWRITRNGTAVGGFDYQAVEQFCGFAPPYMNPFPFHFRPNDVIAIEFWNTADTTRIVRGRLKGMTTCRGADALEGGS